MIFLDLLATRAKYEGVRRTASGFEVVEPWGNIRLNYIELAEGWYELAVTGGVVHLELYDVDRYQRIELQAADRQHAFVHLSGGRYLPSFKVGGRPGLYNIQSGVLRSFGIIARYRLFAGRLLQAIVSGMRPQQLYALILKVIQKSETYGIRAKQQGKGPSTGLLSAADFTFDNGRLNVAERLARLGRLPVFLMQRQGDRAPTVEAVREQVYPNIVSDAHASHDFILVTGDDERLSPDALLLFAEYAERHPDKQVILADKRISGNPTARIAWDPVLYEGRLPTPFAYRKGATPQASFLNAHEFGLISVPLANGIAIEQRERTAESFRNEEGLPCSIIIPTRDRADLLQACLEGLFERTAWLHEVIIVDNGSVEAETFALFEAYVSRGLKVLRADMPFNFSALCNLGAERASHDYLVFLNNDVVLQRPDWLGNMMRHAIREEVGAVGARLLYADGSLQHGGIMLGLTQLCGHSWRGFSEVEQQNEPRLRRSSLRAAVTGACLCVDKRKFDEVGGFDAERFPITLNDVDLCLRLWAAGYVNVYAADAVAYHLEGVSRMERADASKLACRLRELRLFHELWAERIDHDPWISPAVARSCERFDFL